jgi:amino acid adenylation domain-containing protein
MQNSAICYLEATAKKFPERIAVDDTVTTYTFSQLQKKASTLSFVLSEKLGDLQNQPICVFLPKSSDCILSFAAILYSGNFYVPIDAKMPDARLEKIIENLSPALVITLKSYAEKCAGLKISNEKLVFIDEVDFSKDFEPTAYLQTIDTDPAYVIYTSGSTGTPKGVVVCHRGIIDYIDWAKDCYHFTENDNIGNQAPFYFDNSTLDVYTCFSTGATLTIIPEGTFTFPVKLVDFLRQKKITSIFWVPSVLSMVTNTDSLRSISENPLSLRFVLFAGEVMPNKQLNYWRASLPNALFSNLYGPTEITVDCTYYICDREFKDDEPLPIGVPCRNSDVLILDENDNLVKEAGKIGELCVRGSSLALGYWNNPEKTSAAFVQNPLQKNYPERIYRTGDLVSLNERGEIMYAGRKDNQIKHMGYRIELGEIETAASCVPGIKRSAVLYKKAEQRLVMFYEADKEIEVKDIRLGIAGMLPKYMIPHEYIWKKEMPENMNGKIDRALLNKQVNEG